MQLIRSDHVAALSFVAFSEYTIRIKNQYGINSMLLTKNLVGTKLFCINCNYPNRDRDTNTVTLTKLGRKYIHINDAPYFELEHKSTSLYMYLTGNGFNDALMVFPDESSYQEYQQRQGLVRELFLFAKSNVDNDFDNISLENLKQIHKLMGL